MTRRKQKLSRSKSRTAWLAWLAWGIFGSIFLFEDTEGGSGVFAWIFTAPFWLMFAAWPLLWVWLKSRRDPALVEIDDDIAAGDAAARLVQKDGVRYAEAEGLRKTFGVEVPRSKTVRLAGGDEDFVRIDDLRELSRDAEGLRRWLEVVDSVPSP